MSLKQQEKRRREMLSQDDRLVVQGAEVTVGLHRDLKTISAGLGMKIGEAWREAVADWIDKHNPDGPNAEVVLSVAKITPEWRERIKLLIDLIQSNNDPKILEVLAVILERADTRRKRK
jgi:hypothetical protein